MIPVKLTIKGLYSYQEETVIDFTHLISAGLFGIFGAVGSGKSSILEAITFALYGETERLNSRDSRSYNMMNLRCNEMLIDFEFTSGPLDAKYKFTVSCKRNKKRYNETGAFDRKAYEWLNNNWHPIQKDAAQILGLSYDNFKRTIIIPQGKFQEFLQLKETDRVQMLKEIFNLEKFELGPKVSLLSKDNDLKISNTEGQMQNLPEYDEAALQQNMDEIFSHQKLADQHTAALKIKQQQEKEYDAVKQLFVELEIKSTQHKKLQIQEQSFIELEKSTSEYEYCGKTFKHLFDNRDKLIENDKKLQDNLTQQKKKANEITLIIKQNENVVNDLSESYKNKEQLLLQANELEKIILIKELHTTIQALQDRLTKGQAILIKKEAEYEDLSHQLKDLQLTIETKQNAMPDTSLLIKLNEWFNKKSQMMRELEISEIEKQSLDEKISAAIYAITGKIKLFPQLFMFEAMPDSIAVVEAKVEIAYSAYEDNLQQLKEELSHFRLSDKLQEFATNLQEGTPCPLCGSAHHPQIFTNHHTKEAIKNAENKIQLIENEKRIIQQLLVTLSGLYTGYTGSLQNVTDKANQIKVLNFALQAYIPTFNFNGYSIDDESIVIQQLQEVQAKNNELSALRKQAIERQEVLNETLKKINKYKLVIENLSQEKSLSEGKKVMLAQQIIIYNTEEEIKKGKNTLEADIVNLKEKYTGVILQYEQANHTLQHRSNELSMLKGKIEEIEKQLITNNGDLKLYRIEIESLLGQNNYADEKEVKIILQKNINPIIAKTKVNTYRQQLHAAIVQLSEITTRTKDKQYNLAEHTQLLTALQELNEQLKNKTALITTLKNNLDNLKKQMEERKRLQVELDNLIDRSTNLKTLSNLFRSSGFVNYVSSVYLQNLVNAANHRFYKMTRQMLLLELTSENAFQVRDFINNGEVRSIKTLSGGQTFQAALSLALALADNIQHLIRSAENFFFLDEGFGSLDKEALSIVFQTLQSLKKENRIVGIISHVEEIQQEIDTNLKIINDSEHGSRIYTSWS